MPIDPAILASLTPKWRRVTVDPIGEIEVRSPTVSDALRAPAPGWWKNCVRMLDGTPAFPADFDVAAMDGAFATRLQEAVFGVGNPTEPPSGG